MKRIVGTLLDNGQWNLDIAIEGTSIPLTPREIHTLIRSIKVAHKRALRDWNLKRRLQKTSKESEKKGMVLNVGNKPTAPAATAAK